MQQSTQDAAPVRPEAPNPYRWAMLAGVCGVYFCFGVITASMAPLVGRIGAELGLSHGAMGSVLGAWPLVYIAAAIPCGALLDRAGPRRAIALGAAVIAASAFLRGLADGHLELFLAVAVFGIGGPLVSVGAPKVISLWFAGGERGLAMGLYIAGSLSGNAAALALTNSVAMPLAGGEWRLVLMSYGVLAALAGLAWLALASHAASRALERRIAAEPRRRQAGVFAELIRIPAVQIVLVMATGSFFFGHALNNWLPEILAAGNGMAPEEAGYWASLPTAVSLASALVLPRLAIPSRRIAMLAAMFAGAAVAPLLIEGWSDPVLATGLVLQGLVRGALSSIVILVLMETREVGSARMGAAGGMYFTAGEIGGVLGPVTIGALSDLTGGFSTGLYFLTFVCLVQLALLARLRRVLGR